MKLPDSILVLAPHPDDEALMAAGVIRQGLQLGARVSVCVVTDGNYMDVDGSKAAMRRAESLSAMELLGLCPKDIYFLGYPDTGMEPEISFLLSLYHGGSYKEYQKADLERDLDKILEATRPKLIITSSQWDRHGDHIGLFLFTCDAVTRLEKSKRPEIFESLIHSPAGDDVWPQPDSEIFAMPPGLERDTGLSWDERIRIPLGESELKLQTIQKYRSALDVEREPEVVRYLLSFAKHEEIFWRVPDETI